MNSLLSHEKAVHSGVTPKSWRLEKDANLIVIGTMNPPTYGGTFELNEELESRFASRYIPYPDDEHEMIILRDYCGDEKLMKNLILLANHTRNSESGYAISPRDLVSVLRIYASYIEQGDSKDDAIHRALEDGITGKYNSPDDREAIEREIHNLFG